MTGWLTGIGFLNPWLLAGLVTLPLLWHLLRLLPPSPRLVDFAPVRLLRHLQHPKQSSATMPLWLLLLRLLLVSLLLLALAEPVLNPQQEENRTGPMVIILDDGWASGHDWAMRRQLAERWIDRAARQQRMILLTGTVPHRQVERLVPAHEARALLAAWQPVPILPDYAGLVARLENISMNDASVLWLGDGIAGPDAGRLADVLTGIGPVDLIEVGQHLVLRAPKITKDGIAVTVTRMTTRPPHNISVRVLAADGRLLGEQAVVFPDNSLTATTTIALPIPWRNEAARIIIPGNNSAAAVWLLDDSIKRRAVALASTSTARQNQPLLTASFYLEQALRDLNDVTTAPLDQILARLEKGDGQSPSMILLADAQNPTPAQQAKLATWMDQGGVLVRFAGPHLSGIEGQQDLLIPCRLRQQDRQLGGAMTWERPLPLADFPAHSPFAGMVVPHDVTVTRQILAEPSVDLPSKSWAMLRDGTPLVTADQRGAGWLVLFHVTATPDWSTLPISGIFVEMLHRLGGMGGQNFQNDAHLAGSLATDMVLAPRQILNGFGALTAPGVETRPITLDESRSWQPVQEHPPGLYGRGAITRPLNIGAALPVLKPLSAPLSARIIGLDETEERPLKPVLLAVCLVLFLVDWMISLVLRGYRPVLAVVFLLLVLPQPGWSADDNHAIMLAERPWLGYIRTGNSNVDTTSQRGLDQLAATLRNRTAADVQGGLPIDPDQDELAFFPLIYWPMTETQPPLSERAVQKINHWLARGGMIIFDTRDEGSHPPNTVGPGVVRLRQLASGIDIPPLQPVNNHHVLRKSFYLLDEFPGRLRGGTLWAEAADNSRHDGVSGVIITSNDLAAAWSAGSGTGLDRATQHQYELAMRTGINLVMYVLTGNYKADQVHIPFILERLGQ